MSYDAGTRFNTAQNMFATDAAVLSSDWLDLKIAMDLAGGRPPEIEITTTTTGVGAGTIRFELGLVDSAGNNFFPIDSTSPESPTALVAPVSAGGQTGDFATRGTRRVLRMSPKQSIPSPTLTHLRYRSVCVGVVSAGAFSGGLVDLTQTSGPDKAYAAGH